jgi:hypothetical protein
LQYFIRLLSSKQLLCSLNIWNFYYVIFIPIINLWNTYFTRKFYYYYNHTYHLQISLYDNNSLYKNFSTWKLYYILYLFHSETQLHSIYSTWKLLHNNYSTQKFYYIIIIPPGNSTTVKLKNLFGCIFPLLEILLCNCKFRRELSLYNILSSSMEDSLWHWMKYYIRIVPNGTFST